MDGSPRGALLRALGRSALRVDPATGAYVNPKPPIASPGHDFATNVLHVDGDGVCPRCLSWIAADDIVRRTVYGPVEHESCPVSPAPDVGASVRGGATRP